MRFKTIGAAALVMGALMGMGTAAQAAEGCGPGFHRTDFGWGYCRPNAVYRPVFAPPVAYYGYAPWRPHWHAAWQGGWQGNWHGGWHRHWHWHRHWG